MAASRGGGSRSRGEGSRSVEADPDLRHALDTAMVRSRRFLQRFRPLKGFREANPGAGRRRDWSGRALLNDKRCAAGHPRPTPMTRMLVMEQEVYRSSNGDRWFL